MAFVLPRACLPLVGIFFLVAAFAAVVAMRSDSATAPMMPPQSTAAPFAPASNVIRGVVVGPAGPIRDARVRWQGGGQATVTDEAGRFILPVTNSKRRLSVSATDHYIASVDTLEEQVLIALDPIPTEADVHYAWVNPLAGSTDSHRCSDCHERLVSEWQRSAHASSASGRRFLDLIEGTDVEGKPAGWSLRRDYPDGVAVCNACHAPTLEPEDPAWLSLAAAQGTASLGVHCDYCHKVHDVDASGIGLAHGRYAARVLRPPPESQIFFGPLDDGNQTNVAFSPIFRDSLYCAACHEGTIFGVRAYTTYSEWLASPAGRRGQQCQDCHMTAGPDVVNAAPGHGGVHRQPARLSDHSMLGVATKRLGDVLRVSLLQPKRCAAGIEVDVCLDCSEVGHRVPTGFTDRQLLLLVDATDADGEAVSCITGPHIPRFVGESVAGRPGRLFAKVLFSTDGSSPVPFWQAAPEYIDSRLDPAVIEQVKFTFDGAATTVRVRVLHRDFWESARRDKKWPDDTVLVLDRRFSVAEPTLK